MHRGCQGMTPSCGRIYLNKKGLCGDKFGISPGTVKKFPKQSHFGAFGGGLIILSQAPEMGTHCDRRRDSRRNAGALTRLGFPLVELLVD